MHTVKASGSRELLVSSRIPLALSNFLRWAHIEVEEHFVKIDIIRELASSFQAVEMFLHSAVQCRKQSRVIAGE
jgi:hypothetical protein